MVTDRQVKRLWTALSSGKTLAQSADKAGMDEKTARKYRRLGRLPSEVAPERTWRTREDPFAEVWPEVYEVLEEAPGLEAKTLFVLLQTKYPTKFDEALRVLLDSDRPVTRAAVEELVQRAEAVPAVTDVTVE